MAHYLVRAKPLTECLTELRAKLDAGTVEALEPFGRALHYSLMNARVDSKSHAAVWEEEDYCRPPLAMERAAVLDQYFTGLTVEAVRRGSGWERIEALPSLWNQP
ncbi:MAG: hypothetical protein ACYSXF_09535 [Planctomycetota bacterium]|jgi:hypothetical protein